jgi:hypothetical protein
MISVKGRWFEKKIILYMANYQLRGDYGLKLFSTVPFAGALPGFRVVDRWICADSGRCAFLSWE